MLVLNYSSQGVQHLQQECSLAIKKAQSEKNSMGLNYRDVEYVKSTCAPF